MYKRQALGLGLYVIISNWIASRDLPVGVCLTNSQRGLVFTAIGLAIVSFAASFFEKDKDDAEASIDTGTDSTVSYTHLDVYKRQMI